MEKLQIKYRLTGKALPPRPIRLKVPGWSGGQVPKKNGSEPQPWHCPPFVEGATYGLELIYPYETECHVINDNQDIRFEWDYAREPDAALTGGEFGAFFPLPARYYLFSTGIDLQSPPGYALHTQPHPRFFTDDTGTVPLSMIGHVQTEWWPKKLFVVFRVPRPGGRHIFRKGEPYVQILFVPQRIDYDTIPMTEEEAAHRTSLEEAIQDSGAYIAKNVWHNPSGNEFKDHYKVMGRAFARQGVPAVEKLIHSSVERHKQNIAPERSIPDHLELAFKYQREGKFVEARDVYFHVLARDPNHAEAASRLGILAASMGLPDLATKMMERAVTLQPDSPSYHANFGEILRRAGRYAEADNMLRLSLQLNPNDPQVLSNLGLTLSQMGKQEEALRACQAAFAMAPKSPVVLYRMGLVLTEQGKPQEARQYYQAALSLNPAFHEARRKLKELPA